MMNTRPNEITHSLIYFVTLDKGPKKVLEPEVESLVCYCRISTAPDAPKLGSGRAAPTRGTSHIRKRPPPWDYHSALGTFLLYGLRGARFLMTQCGQGHAFQFPVSISGRRYAGDRLE